MKPVLFTTLLVSLLPLTFTLAQEPLDVARYTDSGELVFPTNVDTWVHTGSSLGSEYGDAPFDPQNPGALGVVQMEPTAYRHFMENGTYADGTMFLLSFYRAEGQSDPQLPGFVQGPLMSQEIHVIDKARFAEGRGFFLFLAEPQASSAKVPDGSECVSCHMAEGRFEGTFTQFYPRLRGRLEQ